MARVTVEDCLEKVPNRFALVRLASERVRELARPGMTPLVKCKNKHAVTALREIAIGVVRYEEDVNEVVRAYSEEMKYSLPQHFTF
ncbi:DNA-directed RNA polymerase subunit omega [Myxococcota bacterium]|nr:DNA-directed RNA polymerase subunit omega [Myxococcota bacterium]MBU1381625.1 DNA-directed RNA polymerase subunit omega [Myxococcota bacterium]MBU1496831.1 DNA-directed RNA polymerase subunit omega [Myxococcota bacterium]